MKTKKIIAGLLAFAVIGGAVPYNNYAVPENVSMTASAIELDVIEKGSEGDFSCEYLSDGSIIIDGYFGAESSVTIPETINGYTVKYLMIIEGDKELWWSDVTTINTSSNIAFLSENNDIITESEATTLFSEMGISLNGAEVQVVGECGKNVSYKLNIDGVLTISGTGDICSYAFDEITYIKKVVIENGVTGIGNCAFEQCTNLKEITIPDSVTSIGNDAFDETPWLESQLQISPLVIVNNILIDGKTFEGDIVIPDNVTTIGNGAFSGCKNLTEITIPDSVTTIGYSAFENCSSLTSIIIPDSVTTIEHGAFRNCTSLTEITIPDSVTSIGSSAFGYCENLTSITIPDTVTNIGSGAFDETPWLESQRQTSPLVIVNNILIDGQTCEGDVIIPDSVTSIGDYAFQNCASLTEITIPDSVTTIGDSAFSGCQNLIEITIPDSVTSIGNSAFYGCSSLTSITIENPECKIYDSEYTIANGYDENYNIYFNGTIYGYADSTAQAYAEKYERNFVSLGDAPTTETLEPTLKGDANEDGEVGISDAVAVAAFVANSDKNPLSEQGQANADVHNTGNGLNASDAFAIQQFATGIIKEL